MIWKVSTNKKKFDYKSARKLFLQNGEYVFHQSKGRAKMCKTPQEGDKVVIVCDKMEVLEGVVERAFQTGTLHQTEQCVFSTGDNSGHREVEYYATIRVVSLGNLTHNRGCQRTWTTYKIRT